VLCGSGESRPLFTATDRLYRTTSKMFRVVACAQCGLARLSPRPEGLELASYYPENYWFEPDSSPASGLEEAYRRAVLNDHLGFVTQSLRSSGETGPVLDVGCGGGLFLAMLRDRGFRVAGLDSSLQAARVAWTRHSVPVVCGSLDAVPIAEGTCAGITMFHVLEHLTDPGAYLRAAARLLRPKGRLTVQVPNAACWQFLILGRAWNGLDVPRHLANFRERDLEGLLQASGFEVVRRKHFSLRDNPAGLATSLVPGLDPMARRVRRLGESPAGRLMKDLLYFAILVAALPFTAVEAAFGAGSTVMLEAQRAR
jgi:SAM-dependent methyltransferase